MNFIFSWHSSRYERNGSHAKLTYFAWDPLRAYVDECQKMKFVSSMIEENLYMAWMRFYI